MLVRTWWAPLAVIAAVAVAASAGCNGSGGKTPAANAVPSVTANPEVAALTQKFAASTFQATYTVTGGGADSGGQMLIYKDGPSRFRFDITTKTNGKPTSVIFIQNNDTSAFCLRDAAGLAPMLGVSAGQGVCFKSNVNDPNNPVGNLSSTFADIENANVTVLSKSTRTIAGREASCYRATDNITGNVDTSCFASDGAMLYVQTEGTDANTIEATDVKSTVSATAFDLPYPVKDFPGASSTP